MCIRDSNLLYKEEFLLSNIVTELPPLMQKFFDSDSRKCSDCGSYMGDPSPFDMETYLANN